MEHTILVCILFALVASLKHDMATILGTESPRFWKAAYWVFVGFTLVLTGMDIVGWLIGRFR